MGGSAVGIAVHYGLGCLGIESWWVQDFLHLSGLDQGPTQPLIWWVPNHFQE